MKTLDSFKTLQLSRREMGKIRGGTQYNCFVDGEHVGFYTYDGSIGELERYLEEHYYLGEDVKCQVMSSTGGGGNNNGGNNGQVGNWGSHFN